MNGQVTYLRGALCWKLIGLSVFQFTAMFAIKHKVFLNESGTFTFNAISILSIN